MVSFCKHGARLTSLPQARRHQSDGQGVGQGLASYSITNELESDSELVLVESSSLANVGEVPDKAVISRVSSF